MRVLITPDKFKGTLRADEAARAIAAGWRSARPHDHLELLPMSDGGDGFGAIIGNLLQAEKQSVRTVNAAHEPVDAKWWWSEPNRTAIVESASVIGLAMLPLQRFHPFELDTLGLGQLLHHIAKQHPDARLIIGIGGSATNDAGFGMARGIGFRFIDLTGHCLNHWLTLPTLAQIQVPDDPVTFAEVTIACDVQNPLLGPNGASRIYGPQKGLRAEDFPVADKSFARLVEVVRSQMNKDCSDEPGTGAAGGLGYGLRVFLNGRFEPGFDIFSRLANLPQKIATADLVITAEGSIDAQTEMGKGTGAIAALARQHNKRCIGLAGYLPQKENRAFDLTLGMAPDLTSADEARRNPTHWLEKLSALAASQIPLLFFAVLSLFFSACSTPGPQRPSAESRAVAYLAREVPAWHRDNQCYSCHNNGDGARALILASTRGHDVKDSLTDTLAWLRRPSAWAENKGDPAASDQRLADIQFALALATASRANLLSDPILLKSAARRLAPHQSVDGSWNVEPQNDVGSPVTYGTTLATFHAWTVLREANDSANIAALASATKWLSQIQPRNIPAAAALLFFATDIRHLEKQSLAQSYLLKHQLSNGGWGPYPNAPAETFDTALALLALTSANTADSADSAVDRARAYLASQQNPNGSWPGTTRPTGGESYAQQISTTAWAALALLGSSNMRQ